LNQINQQNIYVTRILLNSFAVSSSENKTFENKEFFGFRQE